MKRGSLEYHLLPSSCGMDSSGGAPYYFERRHSLKYLSDHKVWNTSGLVIMMKFKYCVRKSTVPACSWFQKNKKYIVNSSGESIMLLAVCVIKATVYLRLLRVKRLYSQVEVHNFVIFVLHIL